MDRLREHDVRVVYPAKMMPPEEYVVDGTNVDDMMSKIIGISYFPLADRDCLELTTLILSNWLMLP
jgi:hypothetical protein